MRLPACGPGDPAGNEVGVDPDDQGRVGQLHDRGQLAAGQAGRDGLRHGAELPAGDGGLEELDRVRQGYRHEILRADPGGGERPRQPITPPLELVPGHRGTRHRYRGKIWIFAGQAAERLADRLRGVTHVVTCLYLSVIPCGSPLATACPQRRSGRPTTSASRTPGCSMRACSTSSANTFSPPVLITRLPRPRNVTDPSASTEARSPGTTQRLPPRVRKVSAVFASSPR